MERGLFAQGFRTAKYKIQPPSYFLPRVIYRKILSEPFDLDRGMASAPRSAQIPTGTTER